MSLYHQSARDSTMKRTMSDMDSECSDDIFVDDFKNCHNEGPVDSCQMLNRKKRRGVIEKRRRDRINDSLTELRRLVPSAFEKQGSAKLEKAEILQMTVDHLKSLHAKGFDAFSFDPQRYAMDYHCLGFRECASEVARYLVTIEGMDVQDPLRLRLMSHLQCYSAQRELAVKSAAVVHNPWNSSSTGGSAPPPSNAFTSTPIGAPTHYQGSSTSQFHTPTSTYPNQFSSDHSSYHHLSATDSSFTSSLGASGMSSTTNPSGSSSIGQRLNSAGNMGSTTSTPSQYPSSFSSSFGSFASLSPTAYGNNSSGNNGLTPLTVPTITAPHAPVHPSSSTAPIQMGVNSGLSSSSSMRPYRPWGTELAY